MVSYCRCFIKYNTADDFNHILQTFIILRMFESCLPISKTSRQLLTVIVYVSEPVLSFATAKYTVNEDKGKLSIPIVRTGDISCTVSVICYTRQQSASVMVDYKELVCCKNYL